jgi:Heterokaryon incompatibility protein (HET)
MLSVSFSVIELALESLSYDLGIDQMNPEERSRQVSMMPHIYGYATNVCIWLGPADEESKKAMEFVKHEILQLEKFDKLTENAEHHKKWDALGGLMRRPWFSRRWVVQVSVLHALYLVYFFVIDRLTLVLL